ncbi:AMIN domain-containing protein [Desulfovibrio cuneatus]|uniref:AMIN domain-containing protein n=1 Tax=Desulfovibrio cuneatus TaxID=159728 RepID=UPI0003F8405C|nr:AMIN domain-containing protein [Desulfovibrio cuneatus]
MNKGITLLILLVLLSAMGIVFYGNMEAEQPAPVALRQQLPQPPREPQIENLPMPPAPTAPVVVTGEQPRKTQVTPPQRTTETSLASQAVLPAKRNATVPSTVPTLPQAVPANRSQAPAPQLQSSSQPMAQVGTQAGSQADTQAAPSVAAPQEQPVAKPAGTVATPALPQIPPTAVQPNTQANKTTTAATTATPPKAPEATPAKPVKAEPPAPKEEPVKKAEAPKKETPFTVDEASLSATATHTMGGIRVEKNGKGFVVRITSTDSTFPFKVSQLPGPDRLIIDLPGTWKKASAPEVPGGLVATGSRLGNHPTGIRIVFDLTRPVKVSSRTRPNATTVELVLE